MVGHAPGATAVFHARSVAMHFEGKSEELAFSFPGAGAVAPTADLLEKSETNYLLGSDPSRWRTRVPNYARVVYKELYPGIDAVFYGNGQAMEHDFLVSAGADYHRIRMRMSPNAHASLAADGSLTLSVADGALSMRKPVIYQDEPDGRRQRAGAFRMLPNGDIGFAIKSYDPRRPLVIDPVLSFSTYLSKNASVASQIATDASGNNYVAGVATLGFPVTSNAFPGCAHCTANTVVTFVSKLSPDGTTLLYSTVLGGSGFAQPTGLAVDAGGNAVVSGWTQAPDFPTRFAQPIAAPNNNTSGYLVSLSPDGSSLNYGTLLNASPGSQGTQSITTAIALDASGNAYVTGNTGNGFPVTAGALNGGGAGTYGNQFNVFLSKFSSTGALLYSAVVGSADPQNGGGGPIGASAVAVDKDGNAYLAGQAGTVWPITGNAYRKQIAGSQPYAAPFVAKVAPDAKSLVYSTYLDYAYQAAGLAVLPNGNVWIAGSGVGAGYPITPGAFQGKTAGGGGGFLTELNADGSALVYSTVIGNAFDNIAALAVEQDGDVWLAGRSSDPQFPLATPLQSVPPLPAEPTTPASTLMQFDPSGAQLKFSTLLGGTAAGYASSVAVGSNHRAHVAGAAAYGLYTTPGVYDGQVPAPAPAYYGATYGYLALVDPTSSAPAVCVSPNTGLQYGDVVAGAAAEASLTLTSCGTEPLNITSVSAGADIFTVPVAENSCTARLPVGQSCTLKVRYAPTKAKPTVRP